MLQGRKRKYEKKYIKKNKVIKLHWHNEGLTNMTQMKMTLQAPSRHPFHWHHNKGIKKFSCSEQTCIGTEKGLKEESISSLSSICVQYNKPIII